MPVDIVFPTVFVDRTILTILSGIGDLVKDHQMLLLSFWWKNDNKVTEFFFYKVDLGAYHALLNEIEESK